MFFNKKKEKKSTLDLPELSELPELPKTKTQEFSTQPSFSYSDEDLKPIPNFPNKKITEEIKHEMIPNHIPEKPSGEKKVKSRIREISEEEIKEPKRISYERDTDIYVRIDKFEQALKSFREVRAKLGEIESLLSQIKEVKIKEEAELAKWDAEINRIKVSLEAVNKKIFNKL